MNVVNSEEYCRATWGPLVDDLNRKVRDERERRLKAESHNDTRDKEAEAGRAFLAMMKAVNSNELVRAQWEKFMASLRICGYDGQRD